MSKFSSAFFSNQSMICDPDLVHYACVCRGTTVLGEISLGNKELETLALQCLKKTPSLHAMFSHTFGKRIYCFLMEDPFVYFAIVDEELGKPQVLGFLKSVKDAFMKELQNEPLKSLDDLTNDCFHGKLTPIFQRLLTRELKVFLPPPPPPFFSRDSSVDSMAGNLVAPPPFLQSKHSKKKNDSKRESENMNRASRDLLIENMVHVPEYSREFSEPLQKGRNLVRKQAQKMWWRYVWIALFLDIVVCSVLLGVWLWMCRGFKCLSDN